MKDFKKCPSCQQTLPIVEFIPPRGAGVPYPRCLACMRQQNINIAMLKRGLNPADYPIPQRCELCDREFGVLKNDKPHFDHDHATNRFRGWICGRCNIALGYFKDSMIAAERIVDYLKRSM